MLFFNLTGGALRAMQDLFEAVVRAGLPGLGYQDILNHLLAPLVSPQASNIHKQVSICIFKTNIPPKVVNSIFPG